MKNLRKSQDRGHIQMGWLDTYHSFSFGEYFDSEHMGFSALRVINEDSIAPAKGFGTHGHKDMEIITYVLQGALAHKDSMGNGSTIRAGEVQYMSAASGVTHSEFNASNTEAAQLLQIWILPNQQAVEPQYAQKMFSADKKTGKFCLIVSPDGAEGSIAIRQDARIYASLLDEGASLEKNISSDRHYWVQLVKGSLQVGDTLLQKGDGLALEQESSLRLSAAKGPVEFLLFDLP